MSYFSPSNRLHSVLSLVVQGFGCIYIDSSKDTLDLFSDSCWRFFCLGQSGNGLNLLLECECSIQLINLSKSHEDVDREQAVVLRDDD